MSILTEPLPEVVWVEEKAYPIETDFRVWLRFDAALSDQSLTEEEKVVALFSPYKAELPPRYDVAARALLTFYAGGEGRTDHDTEPIKKPVYSFSQDAPYIYAAFLRQYRVDLTREDLHWLQFKALFTALDESEPFVKIMEYRGLDLSKIKDRQQKSFYRRHTLFA